jgi:hypothetical protein
MKRVAARTTSASAKRRAPPVVVDSTDYESSLSADIDPSGQFTPSPVRVLLFGTMKADPTDLLQAIKKTRVESPRTSDIWDYSTLSGTAIVTAFDTLDGERNVELTPSQPPPPQPLLPSSPPPPPSLAESRAAAAPVIDSRITNISSNVSLTGNKSVSPARPLATRQQTTGQRECSTIAPNGQYFALALPENPQPVCNATGEAFHGLAEDSVTIVDDMPKHSMRQKYSQADSRQHAERSMIGSCTVINMAIRQMGEAERKIEKELPCLLEKYNRLQEDNIRCGEQNGRLREVKDENIKYQKENEMLKLENEKMKTAAQRFYEAHNMPPQNACPDQVLS